MKMQVTLSETEIQQAVKFWMEKRGFTVKSVGIHYDAGGNDPREPSCAWADVAVDLVVGDVA